MLLRAFEALREQIPATLTLVGASAEEVAHMMLDDRGVRALGKVSEERKLAELARADVLCAPSLHGESFGMVLTEAFAAATPVLASDIPGYRDVCATASTACSCPPATRSRWPRRCARSRSTRPRERGWRAPRASAPSASPGRTWPPRCSTATSRRCASAPPATRASGAPAVRHGFAPADLQPRVPAERLPSLVPPGPPLVGRPRRVRTLRRAGARRELARRRRARRAGAAARRRDARRRLAARLQARACSPPASR